LVVAGPGTGKTTLFKALLEAESGPADQKLILTFINNLASELRRDLATLGEVFTFHSFCHRLDLLPKILDGWGREFAARN
jgi:ATP-dependent DNA helicase UvrD/PcrA